MAEKCHKLNTQNIGGETTGWAEKTTCGHEQAYHSSGWNHFGRRVQDRKQRSGQYRMYVKIKNRLNFRNKRVGIWVAKYNFLVIGRVYP